MRQGDPISPLMFDLVVDALAAMVEAAKVGGHISGLVPYLIDQGVSMLQYAYDTVLLMEKTDENMLHMKFLLYCFEKMFGLKINYQKSEIFVMGCDREEQERVANKFNCKLGKLPMMYLGVGSAHW